MTSPFASAHELLTAYGDGVLSPIEVTRAALARAEAQSDLNAFVVVDEAGALAAAHASEERWRNKRPVGLLDGVPVSIKDLLLVRGLPTRRGSRTTSPSGPFEVDSPAAAR